ncbi:hypothetical protein CYMTET_11359 [Cymbomonas tetramitiformis]|uniref:histone deacetylase n=1 Tax=Cymbomonas tetramitiformis TaxID=36881 RepID=A0AAE0GMQ3_9CHLO|nr:hypothetical protein CYMTET_11359 [Cymbomonas tetramitiformis]
MPVAYEFAPDIVLVSAGFDAAAGDPLGGCNITPNGYAHLTAPLMSLAKAKSPPVADCPEPPSGRVVMALEGGYNLEAISESYAACTSVLLGKTLPPLMPLQPSSRTLSTIYRVLVEHARFWVSLDSPGLFPEWLHKQRHTRGLSGVEEAGLPISLLALPRTAERLLLRRLAPPAAFPLLTDPAAALVQVMSILLGGNGPLNIKEVIGEVSAERALSRMRSRPDAWKSIRVMRAMWHDPESSHRLRETVFPVESISSWNSSAQGQQQHHADEDEEHDDEDDDVAYDDEDEHTLQQDIPEEPPRTGDFEFEPENQLDIPEPVEGFVSKSPLIDPVEHDDNGMGEAATMMTGRADSSRDSAEHQMREGASAATGTLLGDMLLDEKDEKGTQGTDAGSPTSPPPCKE